MLNHFLHHQAWYIEMHYVKYVSQDMTNGQITSKLIEDVVSVAAYKGAVILITKNHRNQPHACTIKKADIYFKLHQVDTA